MSFDVKAWLRQTSTVHGICGLTGLAVGMGVWFATKSGADAAAAGGGVGSVLAMLLGDSTADPKPIEALVSDAITAVTSQKLAEMLPSIAKDLQAVLIAHAAGTPVSPPTPSPPAVPGVMPAPVIVPVQPAPMPPIVQIVPPVPAAPPAPPMPPAA